MIPFNWIDFVPEIILFNVSSIQSYESLFTELVADLIKVIRK